MKDPKVEKLEKVVKLNQKITKHYSHEARKEKSKSFKVKIDDYEKFYNINPSKYQKLKKRTIKLI